MVSYGANKLTLSVSVMERARNWTAMEHARGDQQEQGLTQQYNAYKDYPPHSLRPLREIKQIDIPTMNKRISSS
jgi:hypothetical protein